MRRTPGHSLAHNAGDRRVFWLGRSCCTARAWSSFLPLLQEVSSIDKTRNQLILKDSHKGYALGYSSPHKMCPGIRHLGYTLRYGVVRELSRSGQTGCRPLPSPVRCRHLAAGRDLYLGWLWQRQGPPVRGGRHLAAIMGGAGEERPWRVPRPPWGLGAYRLPR